jgi:3',5'-cyclic AMP phosphodiesterase CpdA
MEPFRVLQISDTHLSREKPWFVPNFEAVAAIASARRPDLVVNTGDISLDGAGREDDLAFAGRCHAAFDVPVRAVPGNHDVGDNPWRADLEQPINEERRRRYRRHFGDDFWLVDAGAWTLVGVNAQLLGSGLPAEDEQWAFLASVPARAATRAIAVFVHKPLFDRHPAEDDVNQRYVTPEHRHRLLDLLGRANLQLVASGHVHQHRRHRLNEVDHCWAPSTAYVLPDRLQPRLGDKRVGYVDYVFHPAHVDVTVVETPELTHHDLDDFPLAYGH